MEALSNNTRGAPKLEDDDADYKKEPFYEESFVSGVVVPFCWEERPGVPLRMNTTNYTFELTRGKKESVLRLKDFLYASTHDEKKLGLLIPNQKLLPKPPSASFQNTMNSPLSCASKRKHCIKPDSPYLVNYKSTTFCMGEPHDVVQISEDPFMRAIQACRHSKVHQYCGAASNSSEYTHVRVQNGHGSKLWTDAGKVGGHRPAFAPAAAAQKKPTISHQRSPSSGLLGCRNAPYYDSIVRISSFKRCQQKRCQQESCS